MTCDITTLRVQALCKYSFSASRKTIAGPREALTTDKERLEESVVPQNATVTSQNWILN